MPCSNNKNMRIPNYKCKVLILFLALLNITKTHGQWSELGVLSALAANNVILSTCTDAAGNVYAARNFSNTSSKNYVAKFNGNSWSELGGLNWLSANQSINSICRDAAGNIYAAGASTNASNYKYVANLIAVIGANLAVLIAFLLIMLFQHCAAMPVEIFMLPDILPIQVVSTM